jgi:hypothetical protein
MIKFICDKCEEEKPINKMKRIIQEEYAYANGVKVLSFPVAAHDLCEKCHEKYEKLDIDIKDFMKMSDEEIELALYTFKVGDQVITDDGRVGTIEYICDCPSCKNRGFYEPQIKMEIGEDKIFITDTDKNNGFKNFYKIGDQVFGNLDEQCVLDNISFLKKELIISEAQLNVIKTLKK